MWEGKGEWEEGERGEKKDRRKEKEEEERFVTTPSVGLINRAGFPGI
jgi:hypothetical protein